ncbi:MAG TPA: hypothetical protein VKB86_07445, partial [Pyrinomonadaceae bacterium]|nr:hypothetical protein [Pyrinomonadaceae bacterium]
MLSPQSFIKHFSYRFIIIVAFVMLLVFVTLPSALSSHTSRTQTRIGSIFSSAVKPDTIRNLSVSQSTILGRESQSSTNVISNQTLTPVLFYDSGLQNIYFSEPLIDSQGRLILKESDPDGIRLRS